VVEPGYWQAYNALGSFLFANGRSAEAADAYARVTELPRAIHRFQQPRRRRARRGQAGRGGEGLRAVEPHRAVRSAYSNLGTVYYYLGRLNEAEVMYSKAIELAAEDFQLWFAAPTRAGTFRNVANWRAKTTVVPPPWPRRRWPWMRRTPRLGLSSVTSTGGWTTPGARRATCSARSRSEQTRRS